MQGNVLRALGLTPFAGLATGIGSVIVFLARRPSLRLLFLGLGFSSGVTVHVSVVELWPTACESGQGRTAVLGVGLGTTVEAVSVLLV